MKHNGKSIYDFDSQKSPEEFFLLIGKDDYYVKNR